MAPIRQCAFVINLNVTSCCDDKVYLNFFLLRDQENRIVSGATLMFESDKRPLKLETFWIWFAYDSRKRRNKRLDVIQFSWSFYVECGQGPPLNLTTHSKERVTLFARFPFFFWKTHLSPLVTQPSKEYRAHCHPLDSCRSDASLKHKQSSAW